MPRQLPDFIIGGPPRSGTTWLFQHMSRHPQICMSSVKEPWYFMTREDRRRYRSVPVPRPTRWSWYENLFSHCPDDSIKGEGSTAYFYARGSAQLIHDAAPHVRLMFVLRDPADRVYSHYLHDLRTRRLPPFEQMIERGHPRLDLYLDVSRYAVHLDRFRRTLRPEQILVLFFDDVREGPEDVLAQALAFVGADPSFLPDDLDRPINPAMRTRSRLAARLLSSRPLPIPMLHRPWRRFAAAVRRFNRVAMTPAPAPEWRGSLLSMLSDDVELLEGMVERPLDAWRS